MGKLTAGGDEAAERLIEGNLAAAGDVTPANSGSCPYGFIPLGRFNVHITGVFVGTIVIERSFDGAANFAPCSLAGSVVAFTTPASEQLTHSGEAFVIYRARGVAFTSGSAHVRFSQ